MDTCIAIRTIVMQGDVCHVQAGAGIVADSDPTYEFNETHNKARALAVAVEVAEKGLALRVRGREDRRSETCVYPVEMNTKMKINSAKGLESLSKEHIDWRWRFSGSASSGLLKKNTL